MDHVETAARDLTLRSRFLPPLPVTGFLRQSQIIGNRRASPPIPGAIPISPSQWWVWVRAGKAPAPIKLGPATTVWKAEEIHEFIERLANGDSEPLGNREPSERAAALVRAKRAKRDKQAA